MHGFNSQKYGTLSIHELNITLEKLVTLFMGNFYSLFPTVQNG